MKLRNKVLISIGLIWALFLIITFAGSQLYLIRNYFTLENQQIFHYYQISLIFLGILSLLLMLGCLRDLIIKRIENLEHQIRDINTNNQLINRVSTQGNDELSSIASQVNNMFDIIQISQEKLEHFIDERTQELKKTNNQLEQEIIEHKSIEKKLITHKEHLIRLAHYDSVTSLPNRVFFNEMLNKTLTHAARHNITLAILFIDLDRFKKINDALGHNMGDVVLKQIAERFTKILRVGDVLARLGGDEFIILLNDIDQPKFASPIAEKLLHACATPLKIDSREFILTASIGICIYPNDGNSLEDLQRNADMAMYRAKRAGGNIFQYFTKEMNTEAHQHIQVEASLRQALSNNEFILHYQPKFNLADGIITGVEALIRWDNPELGLVGPGQFIPLAEETGLIMPIGEWCLREACRANKSWQTQGYQPIPIAINMSAKQLRDRDIVTLISNILAETQLDPKYLELEITESVLLENADIIANKLQDLKNKGIKISIDDFGIGYSSMTYLKQFPINILKINQHFIKRIPHYPEDIAITGAVIALAHGLKMSAVAVGVETAEQLQYLADHNCDMVQGYYLSRPLPEQKLTQLLMKIDSSIENSVI